MSESEFKYLSDDEFKKAVDRDREKRAEKQKIETPKDKTDSNPAPRNGI
jgi:hypothetical protein